MYHVKEEKIREGKGKREKKTTKLLLESVRDQSLVKGREGRKKKIDDTKKGIK